MASAAPCGGQVKRAYVRDGSMWVAIGVWCGRCGRFWRDLAAVDHSHRNDQLWLEVGAAPTAAVDLDSTSRAPN